MYVFLYVCISVYVFLYVCIHLSMHVCVCTQDASPNVAHPSLLAQLASLYLTQPVYAMPHNSAHTLASPLASLVSPTGADLPCEVHLLNLRTMQNKDDNANLKYIPRDSAALLLHHVGSDCRFPLFGATCRPGDGKVRVGWESWLVD